MHTRLPFTALLLGAGLLTAAPAQAAYEFYVTIEGAKQGQFKGESLRAPHRNKLSGIAFEYSVKSPRDAASGQATGKRQHKPVTFVKEWGAATPQLFTALVTNEPLKTVLFEFVRTTAAGKEEVYHTVKLTNASIIDIAQRTGASVSPESKKDLISTLELEEISFTFQKIEMENRIGGRTSASDDVPLGTETGER